MDFIKNKHDFYHIIKFSTKTIPLIFFKFDTLSINIVIFVTAYKELLNSK